MGTSVECKNFNSGFCNILKAHVAIGVCQLCRNVGEEKIKEYFERARGNRIRKVQKKGGAGYYIQAKDATEDKMKELYLRACSCGCIEGLPFVTESEYIRRLKICVKCNGGFHCPEYKNPIEHKIAIRYFECPRQKWTGGFPGLFEMALGFIKAQIRWIKSGFKRRTKYEIRWILFRHCKKCEHFRPAKNELGGRCSKCGCYLKAKIFQRSNHCPANPPKW